MKKSPFAIAGIPVQIHWTFWLLAIWIVYSNLQDGFDVFRTAWSLLFTALVFVCVLLHELGHSLTARQFGIQTKSILLLPIGGLAHLQKMPKSPKQEFWITIMGPVVNLVIALMLLPIVHFDFNNPARVDQVTSVNGTNIFYNLFVANVIMFLFNLLPAFPMDGGRILRAAIAWFSGQEKATKIATWVGNLFAFLFIVAGIYLMSFMLVIIGIFVLLAARSELSFVKNNSILSRFRVKDIIITDYHTLSPSDPVQKAADLLLRTQNKSFVVMKYGEVEGVLRQMEIIKALSAEGPNAPVAKYMNPHVIKVDEDELLADVQEKFAAGGHDVLLVTSNGSFLGLIDSDNIEELIALYQRGDNSYFPSRGFEWSKSY